jgi:hypothetical protein
LPTDAEPRTIYTMNRPAPHTPQLSHQRPGALDRLQWVTGRNGLTLATADDYNSKVLSARGGAGQRVGIQKQARGPQRTESPRITYTRGTTYTLKSSQKSESPSSQKPYGVQEPRTGAPCNKGVGDVGTGPNSRTEQKPESPQTHTNIAV